MENWTSSLVGKLLKMLRSIYIDVVSVCFDSVSTTSPTSLGKTKMPRITSSMSAMFTIVPYYEKRIFQQTAATQPNSLRYPRVMMMIYTDG